MQKKAIMVPKQEKTQLEAWVLEQDYDCLVMKRIYSQLNR